MQSNVSKRGQTAISGETRALPVQEIGEENDLLLKASRVKASFSLSVADSWIIATA